jgi:hypothetical protein
VLSGKKEGAEKISRHKWFDRFVTIKQFGSPVLIGAVGVKRSATFADWMLELCTSSGKVILAGAVQTLSD